MSNNFSSKMEKVTEKMQSIMLPLVNWINGNKHFSALKNGMSIIIPISVIGGLFMLLAQPPVNLETMEGTNIFFKFLISWKTWAVANADYLTPVTNLTIGSMALYTTISVAYSLAKEYKINAFTTSISSLLIFLLTAATPKFVDGVGFVMSMDNLGGIGMFYAMVVAFITCGVINFCKVKKIKIKLPDQVPPNVAAPFEALIPLVILTVVFLVSNILCINITGDNLCKLIYVLVKPLIYATGSLPSVILLSILMSAFWFMGIHGNNMVAAVLEPIALANIAINANVVLTGQGEMTPLAGAFMNLFGNFLAYPALMVVCFMFAKSAHLKSIRKLAIIPDIFNINEPITFGVPVMMNLTIALPIMILNVIMCSTAYILMDSGIIGCIYAAVPWTTPGPLYLLLATGDFNVLIMWALMFIVDILVLIPFVKIYDRQLLTEEVAVEQVV